MTKARATTEQGTPIVLPQGKNGRYWIFSVNGIKFMHDPQPQSKVALGYAPDEKEQCVCYGCINKLPLHVEIHTEECRCKDCIVKIIPKQLYENIRGWYWNFEYNTDNPNSEDVGFEYNR